MPDIGDQDYYVTQTIDLNGLPVEVKIYPETSKVDVDGIGLFTGTFFLDRNGSGVWGYDIQNPTAAQNAFFDHYNNNLSTLGQPQVTMDEFEILVDTDFTETLNEAAAVSINNCANYTSEAMCHAQRTRHVNNGGLTEV